MKLDQTVWTGLVEHGVTPAHLSLLLDLLRLGKTGCISWHFAHGNLVQNDVRIVVSNRSIEIQRVSDVLLREE